MSLVHGWRADIPAPGSAMSPASAEEYWRENFTILEGSFSISAASGGSSGGFHIFPGVYGDIAGRHLVGRVALMKYDSWDVLSAMADIPYAFAFESASGVFMYNEGSTGSPPKSWKEVQDFIPQFYRTFPDIIGTDGEFETYWSGDLPPGWNGEGPPAIITSQASGGQSGSCVSLRFVVIGNGGYGGMYYFSSVVAHETYIFSFYYKNATVSGSAAYAVKNTTDDTWIASTTELSAASVWSSKQTIEFTVPVGCNGVAVYLMSGANNTNYFDTVTLKRKGVPIIKHNIDFGTYGGTVDGRSYAIDGVKLDDCSDYSRRLVHAHGTVASGNNVPWPEDTVLVDQGETMVENGSFTTWDAGSPSAWNTLNSSATSTDGRPGSPGEAVSVESTAVSGSIYQDILVTAEEKYRIHLHYKAPASDGEAFYAIYDNANNEWIAGLTKLASTGSEWSEKQTVQFTAPSGCSAVAVHVGCTSAGSTAYFDEISMFHYDYETITPASCESWSCFIAIRDLAVVIGNWMEPWHCWLQQDTQGYYRKAYVHATQYPIAGDYYGTANYIMLMVRLITRDYS